MGHKRGRRLLAWGTALLIMAAGAACTSGASAPPGRSTVEMIWTARGIEPVSAVRNIAGVAVVYGTTPDGLRIFAIDPATGSELWSRPAVTLVAAENVRVDSIDDAAVYLRPTGTQRVSQLVVADPTTGADLTVSEPRYWGPYPGGCAENDAWVCASSYTQSASGRWLQEPFRVERATGRTVPAGDAPKSLPDNGQEIPVVDLYYSFPDDESGMTIGRAAGELPEWSTSAAEIFGQTMSTPTYFWYDDPQGGNHTTFTAVNRGSDTDGGNRLDLATDISSASISLSDGTIAWTRPGTWEGCGLQPALSWDREAADGEPDAYLCHYTGYADRDLTLSPGSRFVTTGLSVTIDRIDSETGAVSWSRDLGDARPLATDVTGGDTALLTDQELFVPNSAGGVVLNLQSGVTRPPSPEDTFWCLSQQTFTRPEPFYGTSSPISTADRTGVVRPCRSTGDDAPIPTTSIPGDVGESFDGDVRVVAMPESLVGLLVPAAANPEAAEDPATAGDPAEDPAAAETSTTASASAPAPAPGADAITAVEQAWAAGGFAAKTTPVLIGGTAVLYGTVGTDLYLIGVDPTTGAERWRRPASAASIPPGVDVRVVDIDGQVAYLRPGDPALPRLSQIVLIDPATGADTLVTESRWWFEFPEVCDDDPASLCAAAHYVQLDNTVTRSDFRINRSSGAATPVPDPVKPDATPWTTTPWTTLWNDLVEVNGTPSETIGIITDDQLEWSAPLSDLFGASATLDHGWYASEDEGSRNVLQLTAVVNWTSAENTYPALDLGTMLVTLGIDRHGGTVLWRENGTSAQCRYRLPDVRLMSTPGSADPALRCRYTGRLDPSPPGRSYDLTVPSELTVTLERVDLQTGKAIWSVPLGPELALAGDGRSATPLLDDHRILAGGLVVDLDDGSTRPPASGETFWCFGPQAFEQSVPWFGVDGSVRTDRRADGEVFSCDSSGNPAAQVPTSVPLSVSTVTDQGLRLVATPTGVIAYRVPR